MKLNSKRKLILSGIALVLTIVMSVGAVFAWLSVTRTPRSGQWSVGVIPDVVDEYKDIMKLANLDYADQEAKKMFSPGAYSRYEITLKNIEDFPVRYRLLFFSVVATYPNFNSMIDYSRFVNDIYEVNGAEEVLFDPLEGITNESQRKSKATEVMRAFSQPVTNAVDFYYGEQEKTLSELIIKDVDGNITDNKMKPFGDLSVDSGNPTYMRFVGTGNKTAARLTHIFNYSTTSELYAPEWIELSPKNESGDSITLFFSIYFDETITTSCTYESKQLIMKNSNGFLSQELKISFSLDIEEIIITP